ncbi:MAG: S10 family serine carboxypeptidase-like protein [Candidatus Competibacteraceae bacterium]
MSLFIKFKYRLVVLIATGFLTMAGCDGDSSNENPVVDSTKSRAGYSVIEPIAYRFQNKTSGALDLKTSESRIWYSYLPADTDVTKKPLFVMINGGPGSSTSTQLFSMNTAPYTLDREHIKPNSNGYSLNDYSWTRMGNLLYIDAAATGFSYNVSPDAATLNGRISEFFLKGNFNPYIDAAQVIRVILRFLDHHPDLQANEVILVGESYSGTRVSTMLNLLLFHQNYANGTKIFQDEMLAAEIRHHFHAIYGQDTELTPAVVARQFSRQILIQPELSGVYQDTITGEMFLAPNSVIDQVAEESGHPGGYKRTCTDDELPVPNTPINCALFYYVPEVFNRDRYNYSKGQTWTDDLEAFTLQSLRDVNDLSTILNHNVADIKEIKPEARQQAYRMIDLYLDPIYLLDYSSLVYPGGTQGARLPESRGRLALYAKSQAYQAGLLNSADPNPMCSDSVQLPNTLQATFGTLQKWDCYLIGMNLTVYAAFTMLNLESFIYDIEPDDSPIYGQMFLENLPLVKTFLTDSEYDLVIYSPAIPKALEKYTDLVQKVDVVRGKDNADKRQGRFTVQYVPNALTETTTPATVSLYYPYYATAGHSVSSAQPDKIQTDVMKWLACPDAACQ